MRALLKVRKANESDNERLLAFFNKSVLPGPVQLKVRRMFHFFNHYRTQSEKFETYMLENKNGEIETVATFVFRDMYINDELMPVAFASDLRVNSSRQAILGWSEHFMPIVEAAKRNHKCKYIFSTVAKTQRQAYNTFIRPRHLREGMPRYHLFKKFNLVSLHGLWPFASLPVPGIRVSHAQEGDKAALYEYLIQQNKNRPMSFFGNREDIQMGIDRMRDLFIDRFLLAKDRYGNIVGSVSPWNPSRIQKLIPVKFNSRAKNFKDTLQVLSWFGMAHKLPDLHHEFDTVYLMNLFADNPDIFYALLRTAFEESAKSAMLVYSQVDGDLLALPPKQFISTTHQQGLYCVLSPDEETPDLLRPRSKQKAPIIEPAWL